MILKVNKCQRRNKSQLFISSVLFIFCLLNTPKLFFAQYRSHEGNSFDQIEKVVDYEPGRYGLELRCITKYNGDTVFVNISFPFIDAVKVELNLEGEKSIKTNSKNYKLSEKNNFVYISTDSISVPICKESYSINYYKNDQKILNQFGKIVYNNDSSKIILNSSLYQNEHFYGFGEKFNGLNQRGNKVIMELNDAYKSDDDSTYKSIPFFLSSRKYGVLVNSPKRVVFNMGNTSQSEYDFQIPDTSIEFYIFLNNDPLKVISQYTEITGKPPVIPKWTLEPWLSRRSMTGWNSPAIVESDIDMMIDRGFRLGVVLWEGVRRMFSEPHVTKMANLSNKWHEMGIKQICWGYTGHIDKSKVGQKEIDRGYFLRYEDASICQGGYSGTNYYIDPTNSDAMNWFINKYYQKRFIAKDNSSAKDAWNLDGIKIDFSELFPKNDSNLLNIDNSIGMHNQHAVLFSERIYNWLQTIKPEGGITWVRGGGLGLQKVGFAWGGDRGRTFEQLRGTVSASLGVSTCGVSLIGHDLGGYRGGDSPLERKVYVRGVQYATFSPSFHDHGSAPAPWEQNEYGIENYSFYSRIRYNILPYLYHFVKVSNSTGIPMMRTLYMHHPDDQNTYSIEDQYYLGSDILVAPILSELNERTIYLPEGNWINFWNQEKYVGKQIILHESPLNRIPVFIKEGVILPMELNSNLELGGIFPHDQKNNLLLSFRLFTGRYSNYEYFHDDTISIEKQDNEKEIIISIDNINEDFAIIVDGISAKSIAVNENVLNNIDEEKFGSAENGWRYDGLSNQLLIKITQRDSSKNYRILIDKMKMTNDIQVEISDKSLDPPEIINSVGWDNSAVVNFSSVKEAESYVINYWDKLNNNEINKLEVPESPCLIPNLENGSEIFYSIYSINGQDTSNGSIVNSVVPNTKSPFFMAKNGAININSTHYLSATLENGKSRKYTYGLVVPNRDIYYVWLKMKKDHSHYEYFRWYRIGEVELNEGENYFELQLGDEDVIPGMLYFSVDGTDNPISIIPIESDFEEKEIKIKDKKALKF